MKRTLVGVYVGGTDRHLAATLATVSANTGEPHDLLILLDGVERSGVGADQIANGEPLGAAACFNQLMRSASATTDYVVFLESGSLVAPGWLGHLRNTLEKSPTCGIAGPSTNRAWNEQALRLHCDGSRRSLAQTARRVHADSGGKFRTLEPLHSLGDFCYLVRREVYETIGGADERYGLGPCWEMDYNVRAARAGFAGVWAMSAFVFRHPTSAWRKRNEARLFVRNKHLYQNKFCARQRGGQPSGYRTHCRGDACPNFARDAHAPESLTRPPQPRATPATDPGQPLVSCIMPTANRSAFVLQSLRYLQRQTYSRFELIIVDDGTGRSRDKPARQRMDHLQARPARHEHRPETQRGLQARARPHHRPHGMTMTGTAAIASSVRSRRCLTDPTFLPSGDCVFFEVPSWKFWKTTAALHRQLFVNDVHGGTLVYRRQIWETLATFPDCSLAEDAYFLRRGGEKRCQTPTHRGRKILHLHPARRSGLEDALWRVSRPGRLGMRPRARTPLGHRVLQDAAPPSLRHARLRASCRPQIVSLTPNRRSSISDARRTRASNS